MPMSNFGDILAEWEQLTGKPYGKKRLKNDERNKASTAQDIKKENEKRPHPLDMWLRRYGVTDKDAFPEQAATEPSETRQFLRKMRPQAEIDLHGMTRLEAENALNVFFDSCKARGLKKVLIIHGKGNHSKEDAVLLPFVKAYLERQRYAGERGYSKRDDGGSGSTWVILKY